MLTKIFSGWLVWRVLAACCDWVVPNSKSPMLSPPGQSVEQFLHKTHFQQWRCKKSGVSYPASAEGGSSAHSEGLGTLFHLAVARDTGHPFLRPPTTYNPVVYATKYALQSERDCIAQRFDVAETLQELADAVYSENLRVLRLVDPFLLPVVARRKFLVMRVVSVVTSWMDPKLVVDLFFGLRQLGWAMPAPTMQLRGAPPEYPIEVLKADCGNHNSKLISRCRPSGDDKLDKAAWEKTEEELSSEMILGPFFDLQDVPFPNVSLLRRFGTWEQHGGAENPTVRLFDDALEGGQNGATGSKITHRPTDLDSWATQCRMVQERFPQSALSQFPRNFKKAYKQVPAKPSLAGFAVMVQWLPQKRCPAFLVRRTQFFGRKSCPVNFARVPDWCCHALATMAGLATSHCVETSLLSTEKQQFSRDGLSGVSQQRVVVGLCLIQRVLFRHKFIEFLVQHPIYHRHCVALQHFQLHKTESRN